MAEARAAAPGGPVGFVGLGTMGTPMARRLVDAGLELHVHDARPDAVAALVEAGAHGVDELAKLAGAVRLVLLSLPGPPEQAAVLSGPEGLLARLEPGSVVVDLTTSSLSTSRALAAEARGRSVAFLDAPVSGGAAGAEGGTLILMVGGDAEALETARPVLARLSREIVHLGEAGAGTIVKLIHNQLYLCGEVLFYEGLVLAARAGIDPQALVGILGATGAGGPHARLAPRVLGRQFDDVTFALGLAHKDVALALEAARELRVPMPATSAAFQLFVEASARGLGEKNFWAAVELVEEHAGCRIPNGGGAR